MNKQEQNQKLEEEKYQLQNYIERLTQDKDQLMEKLAQTLETLKEKENIIQLQNSQRFQLTNKIWRFLVKLILLKIQRFEFKDIVQQYSELCDYCRIPQDVKEKLTAFLN